MIPERPKLDGQKGACVSSNPVGSVILGNSLKPWKMLLEFRSLFSQTYLAENAQGIFQPRCSAFTDCSNRGHNPLHFTRSVLLQKLLFFMQITRAFRFSATRPHCVHHLVLLCIFGEILTGPRLHCQWQWQQQRWGKKGRHTQAFYLFSSLTCSSPPFSSPQWLSPHFAEIWASWGFQQGSRQFPSTLCRSSFSSLSSAKIPSAQGKSCSPLWGCLCQALDSLWAWWWYQFANPNAQTSH